MSDEELPDLATLLGRPPPTTTGRRQSPRKAKAPHSWTAENMSKTNISVTTRQTRASPRKSREATTFKETSRAKTSVISLSNIPKLSRNDSEIDATASSNNALARSPQQRSIGLTHVDSLLLPLSKVCLDSKAQPKEPNFGSKGPPVSKSIKSSGVSRQNGFEIQAPAVSRIGARKCILSEAVCADDSEDAIDDEENEETDLSGFVVDDDIDPSIHESSSDSEADKKVKRKPLTSPRKRMLHRGSRQREQAGTFSFDAELSTVTIPDSILSTTMRDLEIDSKHKEKLEQHIEIVDLTSSPVRIHSSISEVVINTKAILNESTKLTKQAKPADLFEDFDVILRFSPPTSLAPGLVPTKTRMGRPLSQEEPTNGAKTSKVHLRDGFTTPPSTPPRSPSKLKSPSKLLSPSKRAAQIPQSPHRQSLDGFWDLEVVNTWHDTYSPNKAPATSPRKTRFLEWLDSGDEDDETPTMGLNDSSDPLPSHCSSPRKSRSPQRSPVKSEKQLLLEQKRAAKAKKEDFESRKEQLAIALMTDLDDNITSSNLAALSSTTGGVQIIWSKTLRSTAGRANWRRTVTKPAGSPVKDSPVPEGTKVQHYASIELATKVIDSETRLVNTLAHEYCHLANFMVSNVRDQPHGASFKAWGVKVTRYLRAHSNPIYRGVEVTTKHSYTIDHKYLWVCAGREALDLLRNVPDPGDGCGAEYGRHSKSIDPDKHRCGRCKGALIQVRPKPRKADPKSSSPRKALFRKKTPVQTVTETIEIVDLSD